jgi:CheY-specific phosphatase CheX
MIISDTTTRIVTIVLEGAEISDIETICRGFVAEVGELGTSATGTAKNILEAITGD